MHVSVTTRTRSLSVLPLPRGLCFHLLGDCRLGFESDEMPGKQSNVRFSRFLRWIACSFLDTFNFKLSQKTHQWRRLVWFFLLLLSGTSGSSGIAIDTIDFYHFFADDSILILEYWDGNQNLVLLLLWIIKTTSSKSWNSKKYVDQRRQSWPDRWVWCRLGSTTPYLCQLLQIVSSALGICCLEVRKVSFASASALGIVKIIVKYYWWYCQH